MLTLRTHLAAAALAMALWSGPAPATEELDRLHWLAGHWVSEDGAFEEHWLAPRGNTMTGSFRWVFPDGRVVLEYLVIEAGEAGVQMRFKHFNPDYSTWEAGEPNTYRLESLADGQALFLRSSDNDAAPLRYSYTREGDRLTFHGAGEDGEQPLVLHFKLAD